MLIPRRIVLLGSIYTGSLALVATFAAAPKAPATAPGSKFTPAFKAMDYYDDSCRRCHGPQGSFYGPDLGKGLSDAQLIDVIKRMCDGPGNAPLAPADLAVETAFHRALIAGTPYLSVTDLAAEKITGEVMPDAKVTVTISNPADKTARSIPATVDDHTWSAAIPANTKPADVTVTAELNGKKTSLPLAKPPSYSHADPLPTTKPAK